MPHITCPHCGASRNTPLDRIPKQKTRARCPECRKDFSFDPATVTQPPVSETIALAKIVCPHCGLPRSLPSDREFNGRALLSCRRCKQTFRLTATKAPHPSPETPETAATQQEQLSGIGALLTDCWELFCRRGWGLFGIYLLAALLILAPLAIAAIILPSLVMGNKPLAWSCLALGVGYGVLGSAWMTAAMFQHIVDPKLSVRGAVAQSWKNFGSFFWLILLMGLLVAGGSILLLIPGLIFMVWFFFSQYILAEEKIGGLAALEKSRHLVQGHGWAVFGRFLLLLLISLAASTLTSRLPVFGNFAHLAFSLLLAPFSLLYFYLIYQDLKRCQRFTSVKEPQDRRWQYLTVAMLGWLLVPTAFIFINQQALTNLISAQNQGSELISQITGQPATLAELTEDQSPQADYLSPQELTAADYDRLLLEIQLSADQLGVTLGPAALSANRFWIDEQNPHLWLEVKLAELPNLALSARRSARILIEKVLDTDQHDQYNPEHSFESNSFHWIDIRSNESEDKGYSGIRNVYLKQGTLPEQISSISGQLELTLPLGIESLQFKRRDVGKAFSVAGKVIKLETLGNNRLSLSFQGEQAQILSVRAFNQQAKPLREAGETWQSDGQQINLQQMFNGEIDAVTVLVATDTLTRSYPFEITR